MRALLLSAGYGSRLLPLTNTIPKCLVDINGKPLLQYWFDLLFPTIEKVLINTHWLSHQVMDFCADSKWFDQIQIADEPILLGTAGTILANKEFFNSEPFIVAHADNLSYFSLNNFIEAHRNRPEGTEITMMTFITDKPESCGVIDLDDKNIVIKLVEKQVKQEWKLSKHLANAATYIFEPSIFDFLELHQCRDISLDVLPHYLGRINTWHNKYYHRDIGTPESLEQARRDF